VTPAADLCHEAAIQERTDAVLAEPLYWFPVRHHSPAVARHVEAAILARKPKIVFLEGPSEAGELIPHLIDVQTRPPVAIYSSYRDDDNVLGLAGVLSPAPDVPARLAAWYPLMAYSPEYITLLAAKKVGAQVVFMDLPHFAELRKRPTDAPQPQADAAPPPAAQRDEDALFAASGFYQALAESAGYRSWNEAWDTLFEFGHLEEDYEAFRRELAAFCCAVRATTDPERLKQDGTLLRERFMLRTIRETLAARKLAPEQAMVVCGGFHLFLDRDDPQPPPPIPPGTVYVTVVPYSFFRVSELSGYAAGNRAPQFYQTSWELAREGRGEDLLAEHIVATLHKARREGEPLSSADAISVSQHARMLASLRGRPRPVLDDIHDALVTCCCKGDPGDVGVHLLRAIDAADIGTRVGKVTSALGRLPIVADFHTQIEAAALEESLSHERKAVLTLDKRQEQDGRRSVLLHRLTFLEIPFAALAEAPTSEFATGTIFREKWQVQWSPKVEPALVEQNLYGDTIEAAVLARLREEVAKDELHAGRTCERLAKALDMDLPNMIHQVEEACCRAIDTDTRFVSLSQALTWLNVIDRYAVYRELRRDLLADLILRCFDRACFAVPDVANVPEDQQPQVVSALLAVAEVVLRDTTGTFDRNLFAQHVQSASALSTVPFLQGAFQGLLAELRLKTAEDLAADVSAFARAPADRMALAGDFLDGVMAVSRTSILLGADALIGAIDELLRAAEWETFLVILPRTRAAFERLHQRQVESVASRVAERYGLGEQESLTELRTSVAAAAWIARIDQQVAQILEKWKF
jgi:hypothetical protein